MTIREKIRNMFPTLVSFRNRVYNYLAHYRFRGKSHEEVFEAIYKENHWHEEESISGTGSTEKSTLEVIRIVNQILCEYNIKTILDLPCGDFNWMKKVNLSGTYYLGGEIIQSLVEQNIKAFSTASVSFQKLNLLESHLPSVDLIFIRDCLVHFSYADIHKSIANIKKSKSKYLLTTTFPGHKNYNIITGDWRPINLELSPFNLPTPFSIHNENCEEDNRYIDKSLALWKIAGL